MYKHSYQLYTKGDLTVVPFYKSGHKSFDKSTWSLIGKQIRSQIIKLGRLM